MNLGLGVTAFVVSSVVVMYAIEYAAVRLLGVALSWPVDITEACAACLPLPFAHAVWFIAVYRMVPFLTRSQRLTAEPEGYESELKPRVHDWQKDLRIHITDDLEPHRTAIYAPPIGYDDLRRVALAIRDGAKFSNPGLVTTGIIGRPEFKALRQWAIDRRWARPGKKANSGAELTRAGKAAFDAIADSPTPFGSMQVRK